MGGRFPASVERLYWDVDAASIDLELHRSYVMRRVMTRGTLDAMRWLRATYDQPALADFLLRHGDQLAPRDRAYWRLIADLPAEDATGGASPPWAGS